MSLLTIIVVFVVVGFLVWLAMRFIPMPPAFAQVLLLVWIAWGIFGGAFPDIRIGG